MMLTLEAAPMRQKVSLLRISFIFTPTSLSMKRSWKNTSVYVGETPDSASFTAAASAKPTASILPAVSL